MRVAGGSRHCGNQTGPRKIGNGAAAAHRGSGDNKAKTEAPKSASPYEASKQAAGLHSMLGSLLGGKSR